MDSAIMHINYADDGRIIKGGHYEDSDYGWNKGYK